MRASLASIAIAAMAGLAVSCGDPDVEGVFSGGTSGGGGLPGFSRAAAGGNDGGGGAGEGVGTGSGSGSGSGFVTSSGSGSGSSGSSGSGSGSSGSGSSGNGSSSSSSGSGSGQGGGGSGSGQGSGGGPPKCPDLGDACTQCMSVSCISAYCGCYDNPACGALLQCYSACGFWEGCIDECMKRNPAGVSDAFVALHCASTTCDASCKAEQELEQCELCAYVACEPEMNACAAQAGCFALLECYADCKEPAGDCIAGCDLIHPQGTAAAKAVTSCTAAKCKAQCGKG